MLISGKTEIFGRREVRFVIVVTSADFRTPTQISESVVEVFELKNRIF